MTGSRAEAAGLAARSAAADDRAARRAGPETLPFPRATTTSLRAGGGGDARARRRRGGGDGADASGHVLWSHCRARRSESRAGAGGGSISNPRGPTWRRLRPAQIGLLVVDA